jgi:Transposase DDE domain group 1
MKGTRRVKATGARPKIIVGADGRGVVGHAGARMLADVAQVTGLTGAFSDALAGLRQRRGTHDPGRVAVDLAVMIADGGKAISDLAVLRDQAELFGPVASDPTAWRLLSDIDSEVLGRLRDARARARELAWAQRTETRGGLPEATTADQPIPGLVLDLDASVVICHFGEGIRDPDLEAHVRLPPTVLFFRQHS